MWHSYWTHNEPCSQPPKVHLLIQYEVVKIVKMLLLSSNVLLYQTVQSLNIQFTIVWALVASQETTKDTFLSKWSIGGFHSLISDFRDKTEAGYLNSASYIFSLLLNFARECIHTSTMYKHTVMGKPNFFVKVQWAYDDLYYQICKIIYCCY